jgi:2-dehydropantoate 2-reductase
MILGSGAIGCAIGGLLVRSGLDVTFIARGDNADALRTGGLHLLTPHANYRLGVDVVNTLSAAKPESDDVVLLTVKSDDTLALADVLRPFQGRFPIVCAQNGVVNERVIADLGFATYGACVYIAATHLRPGQAAVHMAPSFGDVEIGCYPTGVDDVAHQVAADLTSAGFDAVPREDVMAWKYGKLLQNLGNAIDAAVGSIDGVGELVIRARAEGAACLEAAGISYVDEEVQSERHAHLSEIQPTDGQPYVGSSTWQGLARSTGSSEVDWLNGEIVAIGRAIGRRTPVNAALCEVIRQMARDRTMPGSLSPAQLELAIAQASN